MILGIIKFHLIYALDGLNLVHQGLRLGICNIGNHDTRGSIGNEILIHNIQALPGFGGLRQIIGQLIVNLYPGFRKNTEDKRRDVNQEKQVALIHNKGRDLLHGIFFLFLFFHNRMLLCL